MREYKLTEAMKQEVEPIVHGAAQKDIDRVTPLVYCALAPLEELCVPEQGADFLYAKRLEKSIQNYKALQNTENCLKMADAVHDGMLADGVFLIPVLKKAEGLQWTALAKGKEIWLPVFTSRKKAQCWLGDEELKTIPMSDAMLRAAGHQLVSGLVINPVADDILWFEEATEGLASVFLLERVAHK